MQKKNPYFVYLLFQSKWSNDEIIIETILIHLSFSCFFVLPRGFQLPNSRQQIDPVNLSFHFCLMHSYYQAVSTKPEGPFSMVRWSDRHYHPYYQQPAMAMTMAMSSWCNKTGPTSTTMTTSTSLRRTIPTWQTPSIWWVAEKALIWRYALNDPMFWSLNDVQVSSLLQALHYKFHLARSMRSCSRSMENLKLEWLILKELTYMLLQASSMWRIWFGVWMVNQ